MKNFMIKRNGDYSIFDDAFDNFFEPVYINSKTNMKTDIKETETEYILDIELPGFKKEEINISFKNDYLDIIARKVENEEDKKHKFLKKERSMYCERSFYVGQISEESIKAKFDNGLLSIVIPKEQKLKDNNHLISIE